MEERILAAVQGIKIVDHHCHPLAPAPFVASFTLDAAQPASESALGVRRALRDAATALGCAPTVPAVEAARAALGPEALAARCLGAAGLHALLLDDGIRLPGQVEVAAHRQYVPCVRRVLRIETVAEGLIGAGPPGGGAGGLDAFEAAFLERLSAPQPDGIPVVALKSVCCYRQGLAVDPEAGRPAAAAGLAATALRTPPRVEDKGLGDWLVGVAGRFAAPRGLPLQLHTGIGDRDLDLRLANPLHLRPLLDHPDFAKLRVVLLHAAYPYGREAGYLASVYPHVYLDVGLVQTHLSGAGSRSALRECLHLCPTAKLLFSTDAHGAPERYAVGCGRGRRDLAEALAGAVRDGDLNEAQAVQAAAAILHGNACALYPDVPPPPCPPPSPSVAPPPTSALPLGTRVVHVVWCDLFGVRRAKSVPAARYPQILQTGVSVCQGGVSFPLHGETVLPGHPFSAAGEVRLRPAPGPLYPCPWAPGHALALANLTLPSGAPWAACPRHVLDTALKALEQRHGLTLRLGFESEFTLLNAATLAPVDKAPYAGLAAWHGQPALVDALLAGLEVAGVEVELVHPEAGAGQWEIVTAHRPALEAADLLLVTRDVIGGVAAQHDLRATFVPKLFPTAVGNGCHVHFSLWRNGASVMAPADGQGVGEAAAHFLGGVLHHLPALCAVTLPTHNSRARVQPGMWSGASMGWGEDDREASLRAVFDANKALNNVELKLLDATANPHLAAAALVHCGLWGLDHRTPLPPPLEPAKAAPYMFAATVPESLAALKSEAHSCVAAGLGPLLVECLAVSAAADWDFFEAMPLKERGLFLMQRL